MIRNRILSAVAGAAAVLSLHHAASAATTITENVAFPQRSPFYAFLYKPWAEAVEKASQGRLKVFMPTASLAPLNRQWDMVEKGVADVAMTPNNFIRQRVQLPFVSEIPFVTPDGVSASLALWRIQHQYFEKANEYKGMKLLAQFVNGGNTLQIVPKPILAIDDFKGLKLWVATPTMRDFVTKLGATPVQGKNASSQFDFLSKGIADGAVTGYGSLIAYRTMGYVKYITEFPTLFGTNSFSMFMRQKVYDRLSAADKKTIDEVSGEPTIRKMANGFYVFEDRVKKQIGPKGITLNTASAAFTSHMKQATAYLADEWFAMAKKKGVDGPKVLAAFDKMADEIAETHPVGK